MHVYEYSIHFVSPGLRCQQAIATQDVNKSHVVLEAQARSLD